MNCFVPTSSTPAADCQVILLFLFRVKSFNYQNRDELRMYSVSSCDSGQMDSGQMMCRPASGPAVNWLETQSSHRQRQKEDSQPVAVRVMTNGSDNYVRPVAVMNQPEPVSPSYLAFLYDRAQQPVQCPNGYAVVMSPRSDHEHRSLGRAMPAPMSQRQQPVISGDAEEYNAFSRATPAPIQQHATVRRPTTLSSSSADAGTPTSPRATQHGNSEPPRTAQVTTRSHVEVLWLGVDQQSTILLTRVHQPA